MNVNNENANRVAANSEAPLVEVAAQAAKPPSESFAFVMNVRSLTGAPSFMLAPGHELRRAKVNEIALIKETIKSLGPLSYLRYQHFWEQLLPHPRGEIKLLPDSEWRYFVIAFKGSNITLSSLESAFDLAPLELEVGFAALNIEGGFNALAMTPGRFFHVLENAPYNQSFFVSVSAADIDEIKTVRSQLEQHDHQLLDIRRLVTQLGQLKGLHHNSPLRFLGYFAVLESLLTHAPKPSDPYDSITRQVKKKLALLDHRFSKVIDYVPFGKAPIDTIWAKMYHYRSLVAHGGDPEFAGDLSLLKSQGTALALIKETVKAVIRHALSEPQLLIDLREC